MEYIEVSLVCTDVLKTLTVTGKFAKKLISTNIHKRLQCCYLLW